MAAFKIYKESEHQEFMSIPCGYYDVVDVKYKDGSSKKQVRAGDYLLCNRNIESWRLSSKQYIPKKESQSYGGGFFIDYTAPSSAQEHGLDDNDFEFF
tara:strand:+ start:1330 stop:1623 length:294 start_codon:yes stop_codon:yes gene_type:complete